VGSDSAFRARHGSLVRFQKVDFGSGVDQQVRADDGGMVEITGNYSISGNAGSHWIAVQGQVRCQGRTITLTGTRAFSAAFAEAQDPGLVIVDGNTFSGAATGKRYNAVSNGVIRTNGAGANYLPGDAAGTTTTGGQYI
jgi:hypothetical protein